LKEGGITAVLLENFGDVPYFKDSAGVETIACMTKIISSLHIDIPFGVNVLRNGAKAAIAIVYATGGSFVRCNILSGALLTDQGIIEENSAPIMRYRKNLAPTIGVSADVLVKHVYPLTPISLQDVARDTVYRALADSLIVTGSRTGVPPLLGDLKVVKEAVHDRLLLAGSGVTPGNVSLSWTLLRDSLWVQHSKKGEN
jgi:membrane complex biogenesis BtpA family protein